jgi:hypothetical protein
VKGVGAVELEGEERMRLIELLAMAREVGRGPAWRRTKRGSGVRSVHGRRKGREGGGAGLVGQLR